MEEKYPKVYAVKHKKDDVILLSRSGGVFTAISDYVLISGGVVYGCVLNEKFEAVHIRTDNIEGRNEMRGSKYIQSDLGNCFKMIKSDLESGKKVLFSGTPCQVAGLKKYLIQDYDNLLCLDLVCHGVPSSMVWKDYLNWIEDKNNSKIQSVNFRNKIKYGWRAHVETIKFVDNKEIDLGIFRDMFYDHSILRPSCYECKFKPIKKIADFTIADYWNIENIASEFDDDKGVSLVIINTGKGDYFFDKIKGNIIYKQTKLCDSVQPSMQKPYNEPRNRDVFWKNYKKRNFEYIAKKYSEYGRLYRIKRKIKNIFS